MLTLLLKMGYPRTVSTLPTAANYPSGKWGTIAIRDLTDSSVTIILLPRRVPEVSNVEAKITHGHFELSLMISIPRGRGDLTYLTI